MRPRTLVVVVLVLLCPGMARPLPAAAYGSPPGRPSPGRTKVFPISLRYRQQLHNQMRLLARPSPPALARVASAPRPAPAAPAPAGVVPSRLLMRLQE